MAQAAQFAWFATGWKEVVCLGLREVATIVPDASIVVESESKQAKMRLRTLGPLSPHLDCRALLQPSGPMTPQRQASNYSRWVQLRFPLIQLHHSRFPWRMSTSLARASKP